MDRPPSISRSSNSGADQWVEHPFHHSIALEGDAAGTSRPTWGQGLSLTLREVQELRDALFADRIWDAVSDASAAQHDRYYEMVRSTNASFGS